MIKVDQRNNLILALYQHLKLPIIPSDEDGNIPARPYIVYTIIRDNGSNGQDSITHRIQDDAFYKEYENQKEGTFSFTVHSDTRDEALEICYRLIEYFERVGQAAINDAGFAVIEVTTTQNRSVLLGDHYERRYGFDVRLRYKDRSEYPEESIEEMNL